MTESQARIGSGFALAMLALAYWLSYYALPGRVSPDANIYILKPLIWGGMGLLVLGLWRHLADRPRPSRVLVSLAMLAGVFQISALICAGVLFGFGHSPYARQLFHMIENLWYLSALLFGLEMSRAYVLAVWSRVSSLLAFALTTLIYSGVWLAPGQFMVVSHGNQNSLHVFGRTFMSGISESAMATFLASLGGPVTAFAYRLSLEGFRWLSPILPRPDWQIAAFVGVLAPALAMLIVRDAYFGARARAVEGEGEETEEAEKEARGVSPALLFAGALVVGLIWLNTGMFGVKPALISGPSMKPYLGPGDIAIVKDVSAGSLKVGDVIKFREGPIPVIHRIVAVQPTGTGPVFVTKGDNNNVNDPPVTADRIDGKLVLKIPEAGWVPIEIKRVLGLN